MKKRTSWFTAKQESHGFTLIELLVVIAIIGILSAVVLASLNTARTKGSDAGVKANLSTVGTQAALYQNDNNGDYGTFASGTCPTPGTTGTTVFNNATIQSAIASALTDAGSGGITVCAANGTSYAVAVTRPSPSTSTYWCVDSTGAHGGINAYAPVQATPPTCGTNLIAQ